VSNKEEVKVNQDYETNIDQRGKATSLEPPLEIKTSQAKIMPVEVFIDG
jgi:hypothetical protein